MAKKTKKEELGEAVALAVGAGREVQLETVDFSDPNRPKTCLEVDFPIIPINSTSRVEGSSGSTRKPIYQMAKWWARRQGSVFRAMLIAAATKAPNDAGEAAKVVWDAFYNNHQKNQGFHKLKVADIFMGGGTTIVEGARLGMQMVGNDLNPVAWFVVTNELAEVDPNEVKKLLAHIEAEVKPQIMPFYACECPRGHKGKWKKKKSGEVMGDGFDPLVLKPEARTEYEYEGPEVIYTFWAKHGSCQATECDHRTPIISSPVVAIKTLTVSAWAGRKCSRCDEAFDVERQDARMAPGVLLVVAPDETPYTIMDNDGKYDCPHCRHKYHDEAAASNGQSSSLGKAKNKSVALSLLVHPDWLRGCPSKGPNGELYGGSVADDARSTAAWNTVRSSTLKLIEVRGTLPEAITCPDTAEALYTDHRGGTVPKKSKFSCKEDTCGLLQDVLTSINESGKTAPASAYLTQAFCPECKKLGFPYDGRFFAVPQPEQINKAGYEWEARLELHSYAPQGTVPLGLETSVRTPLPKYQYREWKHFFNSRQLLVLTQILKSCMESGTSTQAMKFFVLAAFQQYLRTQNMFCIWNQQADQLEPFFSKNNYQPPNRPIENGVFSTIGRGNWSSCIEALLEGVTWKSSPWELVTTTNLEVTHPHLSSQLGKAKSIKVYPGDGVTTTSVLTCGSSTALQILTDESFDLVITDPPFGDIMQYSEFSEFFYAWLRPVLSKQGVEHFNADRPPTSLEAVENLHRHGKDTGTFYRRLLSGCWAEAERILKPGGILAFTFHHDKDGPWVAVLESLFNAGFVLEATFPVRSDETKGEGSTPGTFGAQKVEYDIIHVCRKRVEESHEISWARMRRQIMSDVKQIQEILEQHQSAGLQEADLQVIRRGKALEYYSKHYGKVYVEKGRDFTVREALVGINTLLDDERDTKKETPPVNAEPYTRQFLRLFADKTSLPRDQMQKFLRGTGVSPAEFEGRGWCRESQKVFHIASPLELAREWKGVSRSGMARDFDQAMFLVGACYPESGIRLQDTLDSPNFKPHPATPGILDWLTRHGGDSDIKTAARLAKQLYERWMAANEPKVTVQLTLFDELED